MTFQTDTTECRSPSPWASPKRGRSTSYGAYGTLANGGVRVEQTTIIAIKDAQRART